MDEAGGAEVEVEVEADADTDAACAAAGAAVKVEADSRVGFFTAAARTGVATLRTYERAGALAAAAAAARS
jgi:hypothetical protein